jgi:GTP-binding protein
MFDRAEITVRGGKGGDGVVSFRREKFVPFGGPDGGDGGAGGEVIIRAEAGVTSLRVFRQRRFYRAEDGKHGGGQKKHGHNGDDLVLNVPIGTIVRSQMQVGDDALLADLEAVGQEVVVARGGKGGWGNTRFVSSTNQAPQIAQKGEAGEENAIILELRLIADVGIIGFPNVGKSTLVTAVSAARPKIASYPFTTREPVLGAVTVGEGGFVLAEIPGLIDGAHLGRGLGHDFLRHIERTKMLIHLVDGSSASPVEDMGRVNEELVLYDSALAGKPQLVAVNKIDLPEVRSRVAELKEAFGRAGAVPFFISAASGEGVAGLMAEVAKMLARLKTEAGERLPRKVFRPQPRDNGIKVHKEGDTFVVAAPGLERLVASQGVSRAELHRQLKGRLSRLGVSRALEKAGVRPGDKVRCGNLEWEW